MNSTQIICIVCPMGCHLEVAHDSASGTYSVSGNKCSRGKEYGINELSNPTRVVTSTVVIEGAHLKRLPVKTNRPIAKGKMFECMKEIDKVRVIAPVKMGQIILKDIAGTGADLIATRSMG